MTVGELIRELQSFDPDMDVWTVIQESDEDSPAPLGGCEPNTNWQDGQIAQDGRTVLVLFSDPFHI